MTPQFLREEATRFRGMANTVDREASKWRLLKMAMDCESRARTADEFAEPSRIEATKEKVGSSIAEELMDAV
jgi:hypothetical protein